MSFIQFRQGKPLGLSSGERVRYDQLRTAGLNDHQARAVYIQAQDKLDRATLDNWIEDLNHPQRKVKRTQLLNDIVNKKTHPAQTAVQTSPKARRGKRRAKRYTLYSRSNHLEAKKRAKLAGLHPEPIGGKVPSGISSDALRVEAEEKTASSLITTGYWTTAL